jgi:hypothetical protein
VFRRYFGSLQQHRLGRRSVDELVGRADLVIHRELDEHEHERLRVDVEWHDDDVIGLYLEFFEHVVGCFELGVVDRGELVFVGRDLR